MDMQLKDRVALVTGGTRDVGRQIALTLAAEGATVAVNYRDRPTKRRPSLRNSCPRAARPKPYQADLADHARCRR